MEKARGLKFAGRAGAQLVLIVVGVTLALWADAWVTSRMDREIESARLESLDENVERTLEEVRDQVTGLDRTAGALRRLLAHSDSGTGSSAEALRASVIQGMLDFPSFNAHLNVYEDLKNSGELGLLRDPDLRQALSAMDAGLEWTRESRADLIQYQQLNVDPFLIRHVDLPLLLPELLLAQPTDENASDIQTAGAYEELVSLQEFRNLVVFKLDLMEQLARVSSELEDALVQVQAAVALRREALR